MSVCSAVTRDHGGDPRYAHVADRTPGGDALPLGPRAGPRSLAGEESSRFTRSSCRAFKIERVQAGTFET